MGATAENKGGMVCPFCNWESTTTDEDAIMLVCFSFRTALFACEPVKLTEFDASTWRQTMPRETLPLW